MKSIVSQPKIHVSKGLLAFVTAACCSVTAALGGEAPFSKLIIFGDSLSDTQNYFRESGLPEPPYDNGRFCNGPLWIEHFAERLGMPFLPDWNYAFAGATTGRDNENDNDFDDPMDFPGLMDQVDTFLEDTLATGGDPDALYVIWAGANDFVLMAETGGDPAETIATGVGNLVTAVQSLAGAGARHILILNVPDLGVTPFAHLTGQSEGLTFLVSLYNQALEQGLDQLSLGGISTIRVTTDAVLRSMVTAPELYGFTNVSDPLLFVGGDPDAFVFLDPLHPTSAAHGVLADAAVDAVVRFYTPANAMILGPGSVHGLNGLVEASTRP